ncbi:glycosyltransferase family 2 protein [Schumannella soli]|uniref:Glycosyltransferase n=1 Tax=Schumannella soli TaxID=2590779 RepID=A0A506Y2E3_9MICO|nr:glycosyltransferase family 2 protein [Schumannella soli]TPW76152.1 glycosyltransferase [Schumannella soli]
MFIFILQLRHLIEGHPAIYLFAVYSALIWLLWLVKTVISTRYRPFTGTYSGTTSVVVPVVDEPLDLFRDVIGRMVEQKPSEIIVVINGAENPGLVEVCDEFAPLVRWVHTPIPGKRNAVKIGTELSRGDITVLVDSDTVWTENTLSELVRPFADERVGGVTTRQRILDPQRSWITRWADWLENSRALYSMPAQSVLGQVGCLPGRTIAFRRRILEQVMHDFMTQKFLGVFLEVSDDRTLTNLTLKAGYRTVYQYTSLVYTDAPLQLKKLFKQQLRWARGSQYNTLRMLPWMLGHAPVLALFFVMDILLPFLLYGVILGWIYRSITGQGYDFYRAILDEYGLSTGLIWVLGLMVVSSVLSMGIRQLRHLAEKPSDFFRLPFFIIVSTLFLMPVRLLGFVRMAHASGWGTRAGAYSGGADDVPAAPQAASAAAPIPMRGTQPASDSSVTSPPVTAPEHVGSGAGATLTATRTTTALRPITAIRPLSTTDELETRTHSAQLVAAVTTSAPAAPASTSSRPIRARRRRPNPYAAIPYLIAAGIFALEAIFLV